MKWFSHPACKIRTFCVLCRTDAAWRKTLVTAGHTDREDFECEHGITPATAPAELANALANMGQYAAVNSTLKQVRRGKGTCCHQSGDT